MFESIFILNPTSPPVVIPHMGWSSNFGLSGKNATASKMFASKNATVVTVTIVTIAVGEEVADVEVSCLSNCLTGGKEGKFL